MSDAPAYGQVLGRNVSAARGRLQLPQSALAERMRALGFPWKQQTAAQVEKGKRRATAEEVLGLALALETTIARLMGASEENDTVLLPNDRPIGGISIERLAGRGFNDQAIMWAGNRIATISGFRRLPGVDPFDRELLSQPLWTTVPPVVAAIVTSDQGVLVGRRIDGKPPWTFIAGELEPGEQPADTATREVKEETGLRIRAGEVIGERTHPQTGRQMLYIAASPTHGTEVFVGDEAELAEVRWVSLDEADELLPGMFGPVRRFLEREIGGDLR